MTTGVFTMTFQGCFKDEKDRDLPIFGEVSYSPNECAKKCFDLGYKYSGSQWQQECWCGDSFGKYGTSNDCKCDEYDIGWYHNCVYGTGSSGGGQQAPCPTPAPTV